MTRTAALLALAALVASAAPASAALSLTKLPAEAVQAGAACNDGSAPGYWFEAAPQASSGWVVHLQGGYWCYDEASCLSRARSQRALVSSDGWPSSVSPGGVFDRSAPENAVLGAWNHVYVGYCSSDAWSGTRAPLAAAGNFSGTTDAWAFRGRTIVEAVLGHLVEQRGLGRGATPAAPARVLLSGCSAGGQGVVANADFVGSWLDQRLGAANVAYRAFADAGWMVDSKPLLASIEPLRSQLQGVAPLWAPRFDESCVAARPAADAWQCFFSPYAQPFIERELFMHAAQNDLFQLPYNGISQWPPAAGAQAAWVANFRALFTKTIARNTNVFSSACHHHCSSEGSTFFQIRVSSSGACNTTLGAAVNAWVASGARLHCVDTCPGLEGCSVACPA